MDGEIGKGLWAIVSVDHFGGQARAGVTGISMKAGAWKAQEGGKVKRMLPSKGNNNTRDQIRSASLSMIFVPFILSASADALIPNLFPIGFPVSTRHVPPIS